MYNQKPDNSLPGIRAALDEVNQLYMLAPAGMGCDIIAFRSGRVIFIEVKNPEDATRDVDKLLTKRERGLRAICKAAGVEYQIVFTPEQALAVCGWEVT
jgi:hypothetical protein